MSTSTDPASPSCSAARIASRGLRNAGERRQESPQMLLAGQCFPRIGLKSRIASDGLQRAQCESAQNHRTFSHLIRHAVEPTRHLAEQRVQGGPLRTFDIPVGLLGLQPQVEQVSRLPAEQGCGRAGSPVDRDVCSSAGRERPSRPPSLT